MMSIYCTLCAWGLSKLLHFNSKGQKTLVNCQGFQLAREPCFESDQQTMDFCQVQKSLSH